MRGFRSTCDSSITHCGCRHQRPRHETGL